MKMYTYFKIVDMYMYTQKKYIKTIKLDKNSFKYFQISRLLIKGIYFLYL